MDFPQQFIAATDVCGSFEKHVPAPLLRKDFQLATDIAEASILICGLGFYDLYINGTRITKGLLAPYISAPDDIIYYDRYNVFADLRAGVNTLGIVLGNGMQNSFGGYIWDFDKARWRAAPQVALRLEVVYQNGDTFALESDESFRTSSSPIFFDELRCGEYYDARYEQPGWNQPGFDDSQWTNARRAASPRGEARLCEAEPIIIAQTLPTLRIEKQENGYLYDFGVNSAGLCRLCVKAEAGQEITMEHGEHLIDGKLDLQNIRFVPEGYTQKDVYICKGGSLETYTPRFTYHGFRYVFVRGITDEQATEELLTYLVMHSDLKERGGFRCDNETANTLQTLTRRSTLANFYYFPTDCPHREKNGWTGDAALSAEHTLLNLSPENSYREWLHSIRKSQNEAGQLPGIVPTAGWGYVWGNGPAWDCVLVYLPFYTYVYRRDKEILRENATAIFRYLHYLSVQTNEDGLLALGLGDWCPPGRKAEDYKSPLVFTDSVISMDICQKASFIFDTLSWTQQKDFADSLYSQLRQSVRTKLIDFETMTAAGDCQTSQAMALYYHVFEPEEKQQAFNQLLRQIDEHDGHMDTGILGARVIFHVLSMFGQSDLAFRMITTPTYPSYGNWIERGATALWEDFQPEGGSVASLNHHFFGDISAWFIKCIAGIRYNPNGVNHHEITIAPSFIKSLNHAEGFHIAPTGRISVKWSRTQDHIVTLEVSAPTGSTGQIRLEDGWTFEDGQSVKPLDGWDGAPLDCIWNS